MTDLDRLLTPNVIDSSGDRVLADGCPEHLVLEHAGRAVVLREPLRVPVTRMVPRQPYTLQADGSGPFMTSKSMVVGALDKASTDGNGRWHWIVGDRRIPVGEELAHLDVIASSDERARLGSGGKMPEKFRRWMRRADPGETHAQANGLPS